MPRRPSPGRSLGWAYSIMALKYAPPASPAGFHHVAVASSATAVNAPPMPSARTPTRSLLCATATPGAQSSTEDTKVTKDTEEKTEALRIASYLTFVSRRPCALCAFVPFVSLAVSLAYGGGRAATLSDQNGRSDDSRPEAFLVADGALGDVLHVDDLVREAVDFLLLVPALVGVEPEARAWSRASRRRAPRRSRRRCPRSRRSCDARTGSRTAPGRAGWRRRRSRRSAGAARASRPRT